MGNFFLPTRDRERRRKGFSNAYIAANMAHRTRLILTKASLEKKITKLWDQYDDITHELEHLGADVKVREGVAYRRSGDHIETVGDLHRVANIHKLVRKEGQPQLWGCSINEYWYHGGSQHRWSGGLTCYGAWWVSRAKAEAAAFDWIIHGIIPPEETAEERAARHRKRVLQGAG